jgi:hypothetical protein
MKEQTAMEWVVEQICMSETPKEKAIKLVNTYKEVAYSDLLIQKEIDKNAKQCALIACDEVLNVWLEFSSDRIFWTEVKKEIEKL